MPTNDNGDNIYIDNSLRHLATQHPIFWSQKDLSLMGVPDVLPTVPIPPTDISGFSYISEEFDSVIGFDDRIAELKEESQPYRQLKALVRAIADWCGANRDSMVYTSNLHPLLKLGEYRYLLKPVCLISCVDVPSIVYLDAPLRGYFKKTYWGKPIDEFLRSCALGQSEDALEPFDFAMLIALAQEHRFCEVEPDVGGYYTPRVFYPDSTFQKFIIVTAKVPVETLEALEKNDEVLRKVKISRYNVPIGETSKREGSILLQVMATIIDDGISAGATAPPYEEG